jgi:hypothetical protein
MEITSFPTYLLDILQDTYVANVSTPKIFLIAALVQADAQRMLS